MLKSIFFFSLLTVFLLAQDVEISLNTVKSSYCEVETACQKSLDKKLQKVFPKSFNFKNLKNSLVYTYPVISYEDVDINLGKKYLGLNFSSAVSTISSSHFPASYIQSKKTPFKISIPQGKGKTLNITISNITKVSDTSIAGIVGLKYSKNNVNFIGKLKKDGVVEKAGFSLYLKNELDNEKEDSIHSHLLVGKWRENLLDNDKFSEIKYDSKDSSLNVNQLKFDGKKINGGGKFVVDLTKDTIVITRNIFDQIDRILLDKGLTCGFLVKRILCAIDNNKGEASSVVDSLPDLALTLSDKEFVIDSKNLFYDGDTITIKDKSFYITWLRLEIGESLQLGTPFFNKFYTYFDLEKSVLLVGNFNVKTESSNQNEEKPKQEDIIDHPSLGWELSFLIIVFFLALFVVIALYRKHAHGMYSDIVQASQKTGAIDSSDITADYGPSINYRDPKARQIAAQEIEDTL